MTDYSICLTRHDDDGGRQIIEIEHYGLLRELLDDLEREAGVNLWFDDDANAEIAEYQRLANEAQR